MNILGVGPYREFRINDPKPRRISKATVADRLVHHAVHRILYPRFERLFLPDSFACRAEKGVHAASVRFRRLAAQLSRNHTRTCWVLKCDIRKFFASIDHSILLSLLECAIPERKFLDLMSRIIGSFCTAPNRGLPLGNLTSQLFANIYLNELDHFMKYGVKARQYIRYADDFVVLSPDRGFALELLPKIAEYLKERLCLELHPKKISIRTLASGVDMLGWVHFPTHRVLRTTTKRRIFRRLLESPTDATYRSYLGLLGHGNAFGIARQCATMKSLYR